MWGEAPSKQDALMHAVAFTANHRLYGAYMVRVTREWRYSCENALTDSAINQKAWLGHAACALAFNCPENIVRKAWGLLTTDQQQKANNEAAKAIAAWKSNRADQFVREDVGGQMLFEWDTGRIADAA